MSRNTQNFTDDITIVMSILPPCYSEVIKSIIKSTSLTSDVYYIQHFKDDVDKVQAKFLKICDRELGTDFHTQQVHKFGIVGRILSDNGGDLYKQWYRFMCIDEEYREWQQPFYATSDKHIDSAVCLNEISPILIQHFRNTKIKNILNEE